MDRLRRDLMEARSLVELIAKTWETADMHIRLPARL